MSTSYTGILRALDIGPGGWLLETPEQTYELHGQDTDSWIEGAEVTVIGEITDTATMGIIMSSNPILTITEP